MNEGTPEQRWLDGGGATGALIGAMDWSKTTFGPIASWPASLKTLVSTLLHAQHPMLLWWGPERRQFYNDAFIPSLGAKHPAAIGQRGDECWKEVWPVVGQQIEDVMANAKSIKAEDRLVPIFRNGKMEDVFWSYSYSPVYDETEAVAGMLVVCTETTARVLAERQRAEMERAEAALSEERTNLLMLAPIAAALFRGPDHVYELANPQYCRMVNRTDLIGKTFREAFPEIADTPLPGVLDEVYRTGHPFSSNEMLVLLDKEGNGVLEECFFRFTLDALSNPDGSIYGLMAVALDITEQVDVRRASENAQREREGLLLEAQQASRAKDEFFAMLGHELRNPLAPIVTALHMMKEHATGTIPREQQIIERQVGHLVRLVEDLLDVSKIARGKITLRKEIVEMGAVVAMAIEIVNDLLEEQRHVLALDVPATGLGVFGDPARLAQVVANLLSNAARYTNPGGHISLFARRENEEIVLVVKDDGVGISADLLPRVFDLFVQGRRNADRKEGGLGLGLALVRSLVGLHDGGVAVRSEGTGHGSEFEIRLPAREKTALRESGPTSKEVKRVSLKRILVVDDNADSAEMMSMMLEAAGHQVMVANDGPAALALVESFSPQIALLDIGLPVMDGYELGERLHATKNAANCRLIALTGYGQERDRAQSKASGFEAHFVKPIDTKTLLALVATDER